MNEHPWDELVAKYSEAERGFKDRIPAAATDDDIAVMLEGAEREGFFVPPSYVEFLRVRNGTSFNGLMLYGANISRNDSFRRQDLVEMNQFQLNRTNETVIGTNDQDAFVVIGQDGPYRRLEGVSWDVLEEFATCDQLLVSIFSHEAESLNDDQ